MKANELMIGDWVLFSGEPKRVRSIVVSDDNRVERIYVFGKTCQVSTIEAYIQPIPLTPEILEKNGWKYEFDKTDYMVKYDLKKEGKNCWIMWSIKEHNLEVQRQDEKLDIYNLKVSRVVIPCDYVHELQHALRLCGIEKTIEL